MNISLNESVNIEKFKKDEVLFKEGELPDSFFIVLSGTVITLKWFDGRLTPIFTAIAEDIVGEDCVFSDRDQYFYSAIATEDCEVIRVQKADTFKYLNSQSTWIRKILQNISEKIEHTSEVIAEHRILDSKLLANSEFTDEQEASYRSKL
jgi:CRP-like cAMP-binding protein